MSTAAMTERIAETSPQVYARIGGVLYLLIIVIGFCSEFFVRDIFWLCIAWCMGICFSGRVISPGLLAF